MNGRRRASLEVKPDLDGQFAGERHQAEIADAHAGDLDLERGASGGLVLREMLLEQREVHVQPREPLHDLDVFQVGVEALAVLGIELGQVLLAERFDRGDSPAQ